MPLTVVINGAVGFLVGDQKTSGLVCQDGAGRKKAMFQGQGIVDGFNGRSRLAVSQNYINVAIVLGVKIIFGTNHGQYFLRFWDG